MDGEVAWGMTPAYRQLPGSDATWCAVQAGDPLITLHDAIAHSNPGLRIAYTRLLLCAGADPNGTDKRGRFGRTPADCIVAHPPCKYGLAVATLLQLFGADFWTAKKGLMSPVAMAGWMHNNELKEMLQITKNSHPLSVTASKFGADGFRTALAALWIGGCKRAGCGPLPGAYQDLRRPWHPTRSHLFTPGFNARVNVMLLALRLRLPAEMIYLVCSFMHPDEGPFVDACKVPKDVFDSWCYVCRV